MFISLHIQHHIISNRAFLHTCNAPFSSLRTVGPHSRWNLFVKASILFKTNIFTRDSVTAFLYFSISLLSSSFWSVNPQVITCKLFNECHCYIWRDVCSVFLHNEAEPKWMRPVDRSYLLSNQCGLFLSFWYIHRKDTLGYTSTGTVWIHIQVQPTKLLHSICINTLSLCPQIALSLSVRLIFARLRICKIRPKNQHNMIRWYRSTDYILTSDICGMHKSYYFMKSIPFSDSTLLYLSSYYLVYHVKLMMCSNHCSWFTYRYCPVS